MVNLHEPILNTEEEAMQLVKYRESLRSRMNMDKVSGEYADTM